MIALPTVLLAVLTALFLWWFSTGALLWLARCAIAPAAATWARAEGGAIDPETGQRGVHQGEQRDEQRGGQKNALLGACVLLGVSLYGSASLSGTATVEAAYLSFLCGLGAWGFVELTFLTGVLTGPVTRPCPPHATGLRRFGLAVGTLLWHELAILGVGAALIALSWGAPNQTGAWSFALLMALRISAKLNLFLGVPYPPTALLPRPLAHLESYFRVRRFTLLLPVAITTATALATLIAWRAASPSIDAFSATAYALIWTLLVLGIAEHWFLILPVRESALWRWFLERESPSDAPIGRSDTGTTHTRVIASDTGAKNTFGPYIPITTEGTSNEKGGTASPEAA
ncbi:MAG: putative photosynthetic complex assembly protein PuhE [Pseudomonadota bacterium]